MTSGGVVGARRVYYIDWLRVGAVLLLFPFHAGRVFNSGELFYAKSAIESPAIAHLIALTEFWHMPLLFFLAGASTYFALRHRTVGRYALERTTRLLVPLLFGVLVIVPPQGWYGARTNDGYAGSFVHYFTSGRAMDGNNLFGRGDYYGGLTPAHLWFIMFLWMLSLLAIPLLAWGRSPRGSAALARAARALAHPAWWLLVVLLALLGDALPEIGVSNPLFYFVFFITGYITMHDDAFAASTERHRLIALIAGFVICVLAILLRNVGNSMPDPSFGLAAWAYAELAGGWLVLVGLLGMGRHHLDRPSPALSYLAEASYPVYILHQTVIVVLGFYLVQVLPQAWIAWPLLIVASAAVTFALYEVVRRVPPLRFLFGMRLRNSGPNKTATRTGAA